MIANECIILILLTIYSAVGLGTILRIEIRTSIVQKLFIFFCIPLIAVVSFFAWSGLYFISKGVKKKRFTGIFYFFTILPDICEGIVYDIFDFSLEDNNDSYIQTRDSAEYSDISIYENEDTQIVYLSRKNNKTSVSNQYNTDSYEEANFAKTKVP